MSQMETADSIEPVDFVLKAYGEYIEDFSGESLKGAKACAEYLAQEQDSEAAAVLLSSAKKMYSNFKAMNPPEELNVGPVRLIRKMQGPSLRKDSERAKTHSQFAMIRYRVNMPEQMRQEEIEESYSGLINGAAGFISRKIRTLWIEQYYKTIVSKPGPLTPNEISAVKAGLHVARSNWHHPMRFTDDYFVGKRLLAKITEEE